MTNISNKDKLTVVLTLKGRERFTSRFLWHLNAVRFPYKILIGDGAPKEQLRHLITKGGNFPYIRYEYREYSDLRLADYYNKCLDLVDHVDTEYVMFCDNDDFLSIDGLEKTIKFLDSNDDYICYRGRVLGFSVMSNPKEVFSNVCGSITHVNKNYNYNYEPDIFSSDVVSDRIISTAEKGGAFVFYNVFRTEILKIILREIVELDFEKPFFHEKYIDFRAATLGKIGASKNYVTYLRQWHTSSNSGNSIGPCFEEISRKKSTSGDAEKFLSGLNERVGGLPEAEKRIIQIYVKDFLEKETERLGNREKMRKKFPNILRAKRKFTFYFFNNYFMIFIFQIRHFLLGRLCIKNLYLFDYCFFWADVEAVRRTLTSMDRKFFL